MNTPPANEASPTGLSGAGGSAPISEYDRLKAQKDEMDRAAWQSNARTKRLLAERDALRDQLSDMVTEIGPVLAAVTSHLEHVKHLLSTTQSEQNGPRETPRADETT